MITAAVLLKILAGIQMAMAATPKVIELVKQGKAFFSGLFGAGLITREQQNALHAQIEAHAEMIAAGIVQPQWTVEPDPATPEPPPAA